MIWVAGFIFGCAVMAIGVWALSWMAGRSERRARKAWLNRRQRY